MATSSIFANIKISDPKKAETFVEALEASIADPAPQINIPKEAVLSEHDKIRELWSKRKNR
ncbi:MAG: hypothetical protein HFH58_06300 [Lachnospiraceae bacterium]|jgi:hypothetical protein|nr:hypothetical protein [Lachnospiraceae bacterium]